MSADVEPVRLAAVAAAADESPLPGEVKVRQCSPSTEGCGASAGGPTPRLPRRRARGAPESTRATASSCRRVCQAEAATEADQLPTTLMAAPAVRQKADVERWRQS